MLRFFRHQAISNVLYGVIVIAIIMTFVIEFRPNASSRTASLRETCAATVRGRCIDPKDLASAYRIVSPTRTAGGARHLNMKKVALDGLIERELLCDEATRLGISATDNEVTDQLYAGFVRVSVPASDPRTSAQVLGEMYQAYARGGMLSQEVARSHFQDRDTAIPIDFRDSKTKVFDMKVYERQVRNLSNRSTTEFREEQARELLAAKMRDVIREPVRVSSTEAWKEYEHRFSTATVGWTTVKETWAARWATDTSAANLTAWVTDHKDVFNTTLESRKKEDAPKAGHIRHILVKLPYGAQDAEKSAALAKLSWAAERIKAGDLFAEVARDVSDDPGSAAQGGDVGEKTDGFVGPFKAAADALKPGETTAGAVETQFGYHLITRDDPSKEGAIAAELERMLPREMAANEQATAAAQRIAKAIGDGMRKGKSADDAIHDALAPYVRTEKLQLLKVLRQPEAPDGGTDAAVAEAPPPPAPAKPFDASTDPDRPQTQTSSAFNAGGDPFPGLSPDATTSVVTFAFASHPGDVMADAVRTPDGYVVVQAKETKTATRDEFDKNRESIEQELVDAKRDETLALYVRRLRTQAKDAIKVDSSFIQESKPSGGSADEDEDPVE